VLADDAASSTSSNSSSASFFLATVDALVGNLLGPRARRLRAVVWWVDETPIGWTSEASAAARSRSRHHCRGRGRTGVRIPSGRRLHQRLGPGSPPRRRSETPCPLGAWERRTERSERRGPERVPGTLRTTYIFRSGELRQLWWCAQ
jgi:hypothetical protein